jgi:hypothetical protein
MTDGMAVPTQGRNIERGMDATKQQTGSDIIIINIKIAFKALQSV